MLMGSRLNSNFLVTMCHLPLFLFAVPSVFFQWGLVRVAMVLRMPLSIASTFPMASLWMLHTVVPTFLFSHLAQGQILRWVLGHVVLPLPALTKLCGLAAFLMLVTPTVPLPRRNFFCGITAYLMPAYLLSI
jgi:hypothetical protein